VELHPVQEGPEARKLAASSGFVLGAMIIAIRQNILIGTHDEPLRALHGAHVHIWYLIGTKVFFNEFSHSHLIFRYR
jgi:hypothetical protein